VEHLERKDAEIRQLMDAAMSWQFRAMRAEERVAALEAGGVAGDTTHDAIEVPPPDAAPRSAPEASPWRRAWRRLTGAT
jgi:hypothetical protein